MRKGLLSNIGYVLTKTWIYEKKAILIIAIQTVIGAAVPLVAVILPALIVDGISSSLNYTILFKIAAIIIILLISNVTGTYIQNVYETYLLNAKIGFLSSLFRKQMKIKYSYIESPEGQNKYQSALMSLLNDSQGIPGLLSLIGPIASNILGLIVNVVLIIQFNIWIVVVLMASALIHLLAASKLRKKQDTLREPVADTTRKLGYLHKYLSDEVSARETKMFDMQSWLAGIIDKVAEKRLKTAKKSAGYNFVLSVSDSVILAFRDAFAYFVT